MYKENEMKFDDFDKKMRIYEESIDRSILPEIFIVTRLDGRSFTRLTKDVCQFEAPFDTRFRDLMVDTTKHLMEKSGFRIIYGYTQSDEISLLFAPDENTFNRKVRKINTTLAGEASAFFSMSLGRLATLDCRVVPLPNKEKVVDYFRWRQEDAHRNALNSWCYWTLRKEGKNVSAASRELENKSVSYKNELLFERGINFNDLPKWQKRGVGICLKEVDREGFNPLTKEKVITKRKQLDVDYELEIGDKYDEFIRNFMYE